MELSDLFKTNRSKTPAQQTTLHFMDKDKRENLKKKREQLKKEYSLRRRVSDQLTFLEAHGYAYKLYDHHEHIEWIEKYINIRSLDDYRGSHGYFQIDVNDAVEDPSPIICKTDESFVQAFRRLMLSLKDKGDLLIICYEGGDPEIEIKLEALLSDPLKFFCKPEVWGLFKDKSMIIESISEQTAVRIIQIENSNPILYKKIMVTL